MKMHQYRKGSAGKDKVKVGEGKSKIKSNQNSV